VDRKALLAAIAGCCPCSLARTCSEIKEFASRRRSLIGVAAGRVRHLRPVAANARTQAWSNNVAIPRAVNLILGKPGAPRPSDRGPTLAANAGMPPLAFASMCLRNEKLARSSDTVGSPRLAAGRVVRCGRLQRTPENGQPTNAATAVM
jgi:hypothetical protein